MKKKLILSCLLAVTTLSSFTLLSPNLVSADDATNALSALVTQYYHNGNYKRETKINLNSEALEDIAIYFHGSVVLERTTDFTPEALWMTRGEKETTYSYYGTSGENMTTGTATEWGVAPEKVGIVTKNHKDWDPNGKDENGMEGFYITLKDIMEKSSTVVWTYNNGIYSTTGLTKEFLAFTAPCLLDTQNYVQYTGVEVEEVGETLVLRLLASETNAGALSVSGVLSEAIIKQNHDLKTSYTVNETHHWYECNICNSEFSKESHSGGTATTTAQAKCSTCGTSYGEKLEAGYALRVNDEKITGKEIEDSNNKKVYELELKQNDKVVISNDSVPLSGGNYSGTTYTAPYNGKFKFYVNNENKIYVNVLLTVWTNDWATNCVAHYVYWWTEKNINGATETTNGWIKMSFSEDNGAYGDKSIIEVRTDIKGIIVCEMNSNADGWGNVKKQSADILIAQGTSEYKIYLQ